MYFNTSFIGEERCFVRKYLFTIVLRWSEPISSNDCSRRSI